MTDFPNDNQAKVKVTCSKCGAEFEAPERLAAWMDKNPDKKLCPTCFASKGKGGAAKGGTKAADKPAASTSSGKFGSKDAGDKRSKVVFEPKHFHKILNEFEAEFGDDFRMLIDAGAIGGWVTTVLLARRDAGLLK